MAQYIILGVAIAAVVGAVIYIIKQKKNGAKCIGCPSGNKCSSCNCGCTPKNDLTNNAE